MTKIPRVLIPRFPSHNEFLCHFKTMVEFHKAYPVGKSVDGKDLPAEAVVELPIFGAESLDKLVNEILGPTMLGKRLTSFVNQGDPLTVPFVRDALSVIEQIYRSELAAMSLKDDSQFWFRQQRCHGERDDGYLQARGRCIGGEV